MKRPRPHPGANLQAEDATARALGRALATFLEGERDPERLLQGWGEGEPLLATLLRRILA